MSIIILEKGVIMEYIIKRNINLFGKNNIIKFGYNVKINKNGNGFENFDIGNEEIVINNLLESLNQETINKLNEKNPIYISLSKYFFDNNKKISTIEYRIGFVKALLLRLLNIIPSELLVGFLIIQNLNM